MAVTTDSSSPSRGDRRRRAEQRRQDQAGERARQSRQQEGDEDRALGADAGQARRRGVRADGVHRAAERREAPEEREQRDDSEEDEHRQRDVRTGARCRAWRSPATLTDCPSAMTFARPLSTASMPSVVISALTPTTVTRKPLTAPARRCRRRARRRWPRAIGVPLGDRGHGDAGEGDDRRRPRGRTDRR